MLANIPKKEYRKFLPRHTEIGHKVRLAHKGKPGSPFVKVKCTFDVKEGAANYNKFPPSLTNN